MTLSKRAENFTMSSRTCESCGQKAYGVVFLRDQSRHYVCKIHFDRLKKGAAGWRELP